MRVDRAFLSDTDIVRDAELEMRERQMLARMSSDMTPVIRQDHAKLLLREHGQELSFPIRMLGWWITQREREPVDLARQRAMRFVFHSKPDFRPIFARIPVGTLPAADFTASTHVSRKGGPFIFVTWGLMGTVSAVADWCCAASPYWGAPLATPERAGRAIADWLRYRPGDAEDPPSFGRIPFFKDLMHGGFSDAIIYFALAHEYAHILMDLYDSEPDLSDEREFRADAIGSELALMVGADKMNLDLTRRQSAAGIEMMLQSLRLAEALRLPRATSCRHPPAHKRLARLHERWQELHGPRLLEYVRPFQACFDAVIDDTAG